MSTKKPLTYLAMVVSLFATISEAAIIEVQKKNNFGSYIDVTFNYAGEVKSTFYIAIDRIWKSGASDQAMWVSTCGGIDDWDTDDCPGNSTGTVTFSPEDPDLTDSLYWPLDPGYRYFACLKDWDEGTEKEIVISCRKFKIKPIRSGYKCATAVVPGKTSYVQDEIIDIHWVTTMPVDNMWIGLFKDEDTKGKFLFDDHVDYWAYAVCNNFIGNTDGQNCVGKCTHGMAELWYDGEEEINVDPEPGTYRACFVYDTNGDKFDLFKCSGKFEITAIPL